MLLYDRSKEFSVDWETSAREPYPPYACSPA
jgi:hypothetical protein